MSEVATPRWLVGLTVGRGTVAVVVVPADSSWANETIAQEMQQRDLDVVYIFAQEPVETELRPAVEAMFLGEGPTLLSKYGQDTIVGVVFARKVPLPPPAEA